MSEIHLLPAAWVAIQHEIEQRESQLNILNDALEQMLAAGANDAVIEGLLSAIDALDASETHEPEDVEIAEPEDSEAGTRREIIARLRGEGYTGAGFDQLVTLYHRDLAEMEYMRAEADTRGHMVHTRYQDRYSVRRLWFCNDRELRKYASEEMLEWFDQYGRLTRAQLRDNLMGRKHYSGSGYFNA